MIQDKELSLVIDDELRTLYLEDPSSLFFSNGEIWTTSFEAPRLKALIQYITHNPILEDGRFYGVSPFIKQVAKSVLDAYRVDLDVVTATNESDDDSSSDVKDRLWYILQEAVNRKSSDVHIEVYKNRTEIYSRVIGVRLPIGESIPDPSYGQSLFSVLFLDIAIDKIADFNAGTPNAGRVEHNLMVNGSNRKTIWRASYLPAKDGGGKVSLRWLNKSETIPRLDDLGYTEGQLAVFRNFIRRSKGLFLLSGVTNSGKSTLIAALIDLSKELFPGRSHHALEDPPEFDLGIVQTHVTPEQKVSEDSDEYRDYAYYSKVLLRQDPDVISIGEVRDRAVAMQSCRLADTGQLVMATLHTSNPIGIAETYISQFNVPPAVMSTPDLMSVWATQTLVRTLCPHCKIPHNEAKAHYHQLGLDDEYHRGARIIEEHLGDDERDGIYWRNPTGCKCCNLSPQKGESGLTSVLEMIVFDDEDRHFLAKEDYLGWHQALKAKGYPELKDHALLKLRQGLIDINTAADRVPTLITVKTSDIYAQLLGGENGSKEST
ncbi:GspE/PulE family protein [Photobacterium damselae]|uniref:GspE/PulE family protein n=2 Tax=Photobacterium damselae TaxID=38293 RepID=UPI001EFCAF19|nr:ATPase, T2SS/T4P/T4SS family [Photobacterium damselae]MCG9706488.1 Flp pilus assembly complex ATPase component TadA [Photobacterium damselae]